MKAARQTPKLIDTSILSSMVGFALPVLIELKLDRTLSIVFSILPF